MRISLKGVMAHPWVTCSGSTALRTVRWMLLCPTTHCQSCGCRPRRLRPTLGTELVLSDGLLSYHFLRQNTTNDSRIAHQVRELVEEEAASNSCSTVLGSSGARNGSGGHRLPDMMSTMNVVDALPQVRWAAEALLAALGCH